MEIEGVCQIKHPPPPQDYHGILGGIFLVSFLNNTPCIKNVPNKLFPYLGK